MGKKEIIVDYTGQTVGCFTVVKYANKRCSSGSVWRAVCKCGRLAEISSRTIRRTIQRGYNTGCGFCEYSAVKNKMSADDKAINQLYCTYRSAAKRRRLEFTLTKNEFIVLIKGNCHYCNATPSQVFKTSIGDTCIYNGIDRLDPSIGYVSSNVTSSCGTCNLMKQSLTKEQFLDRILKIVKNIY